MTITATALDLTAQRLQTVDKHISAGKLPQAAKELNAAVKLSPRDARVYLLGAKLAEAAGNPQGARDAVLKAFTLAPTWPVAAAEAAFLHARQNMFSDAMAFAERAVQLDGNNPDVLIRVIEVAHRARNLQMAATWLQRAVSAAPDNVLVKRLAARDLRLNGRHEQAVAAYTEILALVPNDAEAMVCRVQSALAAGDRALALQDCESLLKLLPGNDEVQFWHAVASGNTPSKQPASIVRALFDEHADFYNQQMVENLNYQLPYEVARTITERYAGRTLNVLDLGCGTGLLGACLGRIQGALVGVDISSRMIDQAARHNVYDSFHNVDLLDALDATPESLYDVVSVLEAFIYVGNLTKAIPDAFRILKAQGHLIFSCERASEDEADLVLRPSQRYAHKVSHVESLCRAAGFESVIIEPKVLRTENGVPVEGFLVIAQKSGT